jgi:hypothetical protein
MEASKIPATKTARLLMSFQSVELLPEHRNYNDQYPALRDYGMAPSVATALIRWGEQNELVCTFEDSKGRGRNAYSWQPAFLAAAVAKHIELFGELAKADIPAQLYNIGQETWWKR